MTTKPPKFTADQFKPTPYNSPEDKAKYANDLARFVLAGCPQSKFSKVLYRRLSLTFGHIAHYDVYGFFSNWFTTADDRSRWVAHVLAYPCYGSPDHTFSDVERAIQAWIRREGIDQQFARLASAEVSRNNINEAARLLKAMDPDEQRQALNLVALNNLKGDRA